MPDSITLPKSDLAELMAAAAREGAKQALASIGLHDEDAAKDVRELRTLLESWRSTKSTIWQTVVKWGVGIVLIGLSASMAMHSKMFGGQ